MTPPEELVRAARDAVHARCQDPESTDDDLADAAVAAVLRALPESEAARDKATSALSRSKILRTSSGEQVAAIFAAIAKLADDD